MNALPTALQLYSVREDCVRDLPGTLKAVTTMGCYGVEFAGYYSPNAAALKQMLDDLEIHEESIAFHKRLDNSFLIAPGFAEQESDPCPPLECAEKCL